MLKRVQNEMTLLIFRFLKKKLQSSEEAKSRTTLLLKYLTILLNLISNKYSHIHLNLI